MKTAPVPPPLAADYSEPAAAKVRAMLEAARHRISTEIRHYPAPIPACDQDFNHLLEERARITDELGRLHEAASQSTSRAELVTRVAQFIRASRYVADESKRILLSELNAGAVTLNA